MEVGYSVAALIWAIVCAIYTVSDAHVHSTQKTVVVTSTLAARDFTTTTSTNTTMTSAVTSTTSSTGSSVNVTVNDVTTKQTNQTCMAARSKDFYRCLNNLGDNSMKHFETKNLTEFLVDLCDPNVSKPHLECLGEHFKACPEFLNTIHVQMLQFGPYHIRDIIYFHSVDQMCDCAIGLVCVQEFIRIRSKSNFTKTTIESPMVKVPEYKEMCDKTNGRWIDCVRKHLVKCESALNRKYHAQFTREHAKEVKRMYDFRREHCDTVALKDFDKENQCVVDFNQKVEYKQCLRDSQEGSPRDKLCGMRECVENSMGRICNSSTVDVYIDAVNIFRHEGPKFLNFPCSSAVDVGFSVFTLVIAVIIVLMY